MIAASAIRQFKSRFGGVLLTPVDQEYNAARTVFNAMIDRRPALIAQCTNAEVRLQGSSISHPAWPLSGLP